MSLTLQFILAMSCVLPAIPGLLKFRKAGSNYHPFLLLLFAAVVTELLADIPMLLYNDYSIQSVVYPFYFIIEIFLMLLFYRLNNIIASTFWVYAIPLTGLVVYMVNYYYRHSFENWLAGYCTTGFTIINLLLAIKLLSNEIFETKIPPLKNPKMIIAFGCTLFYSYYLLVKIFISLSVQTDLYKSIFSVHQIINVVSYIIFTWAVIWIPGKIKY